MNSSFATDTHVGRPRILFIGAGESTHTHAWIDLLENEPFNVRLFIAPGSLLPPDSWKVRTYVPNYDCGPLDPTTRLRFFDKGKVKRLIDRYAGRIAGRKWDGSRFAAEWLAEVIRTWQPDIIHTLDLEHAAIFYLEVRRRFGLGGAGKWVAQVRGGTDLALRRLLPNHAERIREVLRECDQLIADNEKNYQYALELGLKKESLSPLGVVPGTGGIDVEALARGWKGPPSQRRTILWPKAYDSPQFKALSIFEALKIAWEQIRPCDIYMLASSPESRMWFQTLPQEIRDSSHIGERIPRAQVLQLMAQSRVMLAPSLLDGVPNSMYEAMAAGAFPIVSPLDTIRPIVADVENVLFARNLYPDEIAAALGRAMTDDALVDAAARRNLEFVRRVANREEIRARVVNFYEQLAAGS